MGRLTVENERPRTRAHKEIVLMPEISVAYSLDEIRAMAPRSSAVTLGVFDGVHRGHQAIIEELIRARDDAGIESIYLITFDPHPVLITGSRKPPPILSTIEERIDLFGEFPLDGVYVIKFDEETAAMDYRDFVQVHLLDAMDMKTLVLGYDCHFGKDRAGSPESVQAVGRERGFDVKIVPPFQLEGQIISSTYIRYTLMLGDLVSANKLIGHPYTLRGRVKKGVGKGRSLGFPTANLDIGEPAKLLPAAGAYAVQVKLNGVMFDGMMNVGTAPTIKSGEEEVEVNIFDFTEDIYGESITVYCRSYLREEKRFPSVGALVKQLCEDREAARKTLKIS